MSVERLMSGAVAVSEVSVFVLAGECSTFGMPKYLRLKVIETRARILMNSHVGVTTCGVRD